MTVKRHGLLLLAALLGTAIGPILALQRGHSFVVPTIDPSKNDGGGHGLAEPPDEELLSAAEEDAEAVDDQSPEAAHEQQRLSTLQTGGAAAAGRRRRRRRGSGSSSGFALKVQTVLKKMAAKVKAHDAALAAFREEIDAKLKAAKEALAAKKDDVAEAVRSAAAEVAKAQEEAIQKMVMEAVDEHHASHKAEKVDHERQMRELFEKSVGAVRAKMDHFEKELADLKATFAAHATDAGPHHDGADDHGKKPGHEGQSTSTTHTTSTTHHA